MTQLQNAAGNESRPNASFVQDNLTLVRNDRDVYVDAVTSLALAMAGIGMASNAIAFVAVYASHTQNKVLRLGLINLSVADFIISLSTSVLLGFDYHWVTADHAANKPEQQLYRREWCSNEVFRRVWAMATDANQLTLVFLAGQQFIILRWPLQNANGMSTRKALYILALLWCLSAIFGFAQTVTAIAVTSAHPNVELWPYKGTTRFCYQLILYEQTANSGVGYEHGFGQVEHRRVFLWLGVSLLVFVLLALFTSYGYMLAAIGRIRKLSRSSQPLTGANRQSGRRTAMVVTAAVTTVCLACYLPLFVHHAIVELGCESCNQPIYFAALMAFMCVAPIADPIIYTMRLKPMRDGFLSAVRKCCPVAAPHAQPPTDGAANQVLAGSSRL